MLSPAACNYEVRIHLNKEISSEAQAVLWTSNPFENTLGGHGAESTDVREIVRLERIILGEEDDRKLKLARQEEERERRREQRRKQAARGVPSWKRAPRPWTPLAGDVIDRQEKKYVYVPEDAIVSSDVRSFTERSKLYHYRFDRVVGQIRSMFAPALAMFILVTAFVRLINRPAEKVDQLYVRSTLVYQQPASDSFAQKFGGSCLNGLVVIGAVTGVTVVFGFAFLRTSRASIEQALKVFIMLCIAGPWTFFVYQLFSLHHWPLDYINFSLFMFNFICTGYVSIFYFPYKMKALATRIYLMAIAMALAWPFTEFPEWSVWVTLVFLGIYDLFAVLAPCGPLKKLIDEGDAIHKEPLPGIMYQGDSFMLGLGDFVFYGVLVGRAALADNFLFHVITCSLSVMMGLAFTMLWVISSSARALPALPISIFLGVTTYALSSTVLIDYCTSLAVARVAI